MTRKRKSLILLIPAVLLSGWIAKATATTSDCCCGDERDPCGFNDVPCMCCESAQDIGDGEAAGF